MSILPASGTPGFPQCAYSCVPFTGATNACLPPQAPVTNQQAYNSCFCQSAILQSFYTSPNGICDAFCPNPGDRQQLITWFQTYCNQVRAGQVPQGSTSSTLVTTSTAAPQQPAPTGNSQESGSISDGSSIDQSNRTNGDQPGWFSKHWRDVLMICIIFPGLLVVAIIAFWLRRRYRRKKEAQRAAASGFMPPMTTQSLGARSLPGQEMWGPHQHMAHTQGWEYGAEEDAEYVRSGGIRSENHGKMKPTSNFASASHGSRKKKEKRAKGKHQRNDSHGTDGNFDLNSDDPPPQRRLSKHRDRPRRTSSRKGGSRHDRPGKDDEALTPIPSRGTDNHSKEIDPDEIKEIK